MGGPTWTPLADGAPVFQVFRADDSVVKSLAHSQVALHEQRAAYNALLNATAKDKEEWARLKEELVGAFRSPRMAIKPFIILLGQSVQIQASCLARWLTFCCAVSALLPATPAGL